MDWVDVVWPMLAAASFVLGLAHVVLWRCNPRDRSHLVFTLTALCVGALALLELASLHAHTPASMAAIIRYWQVPASLLVGVVVYGTHVMFGQGSVSLAVAAVSLRALALLLNFATGVNLNFQAIEAVGHTTWLGAQIAYPVGQLNPWVIIAQVSNVLVIAYLAQTLYRIWRRTPARRAALALCAGWLLLVLTMLLSNMMLVLGLGRLPLGTAPGSVVVVAVLSTLIVAELRRGRRLASRMREGELRHLRARRELDLAADDAHLGLWQWDMVSGAFTQNHTNRALLGHVNTDTDTDTPAARVLFGHAELREEEERAFREAIRRPAYEFEYRIQQPDGERRWILLRGGVEHGPLGDPLLVRGVTLDVTRRKEQADVLRTLLEAAPSGLLVLDATGTVRYANVEAARTFHYPQEAMAGMHVGALVADRAHAGELALWERFIAEAQPGALGGAHDLHGARNGGEAFPMEVRMCRVQLEEQTRVMVAVTDLSARRQLEYEMAMERESVAHLARVTMLGELSGSLAHELNQPLAAILSNAQAALRIIDRDPSDVEQVREILSDIVDTDRRAGQVIGRLRGMLRREAREFVPLDVNEVVQECVRLIRNDLLNRRVSYRLNLMPGLPACRGDAIQLQQVLMNLIRNACDALPEDPAHRIVRVRTNRSDAGVCAEVLDSGTGIPEDMLERIFTPFETTKATGMGMGLAVCRTIVRAHGGRIWAENVKPHGARVSFELPVAG